MFDVFSMDLTGSAATQKKVIKNINSLEKTPDKYGTCFVAFDVFDFVRDFDVVIKSQENALAMVSDKWAINMVDIQRICPEWESLIYARIVFPILHITRTVVFIVTVGYYRMRPPMTTSFIKNMCTLEEAMDTNNNKMHTCNAEQPQPLPPVPVSRRLDPSLLDANVGRFVVLPRINGVLIENGDPISTHRILEICKLYAIKMGDSPPVKKFWFESGVDDEVPFVDQQEDIYTQHFMICAFCGYSSRLDFLLKKYDAMFKKQFDADRYFLPAMLKTNPDYKHAVSPSLFLSELHRQIIVLADRCAKRNRAQNRPLQLKLAHELFVAYLEGDETFPDDTEEIEKKEETHHAPTFLEICMENME